MKMQKRNTTYATTQKRNLARVATSLTHTKRHKRQSICGKAGRAVLIVPKLSQTASFSHAVACSIAETQKKGNPVARYDVQNKRVYLEYPDRKKVYVE